MTSNMNFTDRASKALSDAMAIAEQYAHPQLLPLHLASSLLDPPIDESKDQQATVNASHGSASQSLFRQVVERAHGDPQAFQRALNRALVRLPSQNPPPDQIAMAPSFTKVLRGANELQKVQKEPKAPKELKELPQNNLEINLLKVIKLETKLKKIRKKKKKLLQKKNKLF